MFEATQRHLVNQKDLTFANREEDLNFPELTILMNEKIRTQSTYSVQILSKGRALIWRMFGRNSHKINTDLKIRYSNLSRIMFLKKSSVYSKDEWLVELTRICRERNIPIIEISNSESIVAKGETSSNIRFCLSYEHSIGDMYRKLLRIQEFKLVIVKISMPRNLRQEVSKMFYNQKNQILLWM